MRARPGNRFRRARGWFVRYGSPSGRVEDRTSAEDFGIVTGVLPGREHEGTGGILERHDLSAAFGGKRWTGHSAGRRCAGENRPSDALCRAAL